jgi:integrase
MSERKVRFTDIRVKSLPAPDASGPTRLEYWDEAIPGLVLRVTRNNARTYAFRYRHAGKSRLQTIGPCPATPLDLARETARELFASATKGKDPAHEHLTVSAAMDAYKADHLDSKNLKLRSAVETKRLLDRHVIPAIGTLNLRKIEAGDLLKITKTLVKEEKYATANAVHAAMTGFFNWCKGQTYLVAAPTDGMKKPAKLQSRKRVLTEDELEKIWNVTGLGVANAYNTLVRLLILTATRRSEAAGARWDEFSPGFAVWDIPGTRTKNGLRHVLPLSPMARTVLEKWKKRTYDPHSPFLFPSQGSKRATISGFSKMKVRIDTASEVKDWKVHDLRRSSATLLEDWGTRARVVQKILNHTTGKGGEDDTTPVGNRYLRAPHWHAMTDALNQLGTHFQRLDGPPR